VAASAAVALGALAGAGAAEWVGRWRGGRRRGGGAVRPPSGEPPALAYGPGVAIAPLAVLAWTQPWGPVPVAVGIPLAVSAASLAALVSARLAQAWHGRRLRDGFADWLNFLALALDLGMPLAHALEVAAAGAEAPLRPVASALAAQVARGDGQRALDRFARTVGTPQAAFVASLLERQRHLGGSVTALLLQEEGMLTRQRWQEQRARQGIVPYAFTLGVGALLVNGGVLFLVPRAAQLLAMLGSVHA
jgi:pilus assembly protein TadC